jgi:tRNA(adenine34) deaminase
MSNSVLTDKYYLYLAYQEALKALAIDEVPIGAVIVNDGHVIAYGYNQKELKQNSLAHAEIIAIEQASKTLNSWRLTDCTLYTTLEPCYMCAAVILQARLKRVVYAAHDKKGGGESCLQLFTNQHFNHKILCEYIEVSAYGKLISEYFQRKRIVSSNS